MSETIFLKQGKDYDKNPHYFKTVDEDKFQLYNPESTEPLLKINGEPHVFKSNSKGEGFNTKVGTKRIFLNFGESQYGPYAKLDILDDDSSPADKPAKKEFSSSGGYNKAKGSNRFKKA